MAEGGGGEEWFLASLWWSKKKGGGGKCSFSFIVLRTNSINQKFLRRKEDVWQKGPHITLGFVPTQF